MQGLIGSGIQNLTICWASMREAISVTFEGKSFWLSGRPAALQDVAAANPINKASIRSLSIAFVLETVITRAAL